MRSLRFSAAILVTLAVTAVIASLIFVPTSTVHADDLTTCDFPTLQNALDALPNGHTLVVYCSLGVITNAQHTPLLIRDNRSEALPPKQVTLTPNGIVPSLLWLWNFSWEQNTT